MDGRRQGRVRRHRRRRDRGWQGRCVRHHVQREQLRGQRHDGELDHEQRRAGPFRHDGGRREDGDHQREPAHERRDVPQVRQGHARAGRDEHVPDGLRPGARRLGRVRGHPQAHEEQREGARLEGHHRSTRRDARPERLYCRHRRLASNAPSLRHGLQRHGRARQYWHRPHQQAVRQHESGCRQLPDLRPQPH